MKQISLKFKILFLFTVLIVSLIHFSSAHVFTKYSELKESAMYKLSAEVTLSVSELIHNLQMERGLSAGVVVLKDRSSYADTLIKQFEKTDAAYARFLYFVQSDLDAKKDLQAEIQSKNEPIVKEVIQKLNHLSTIRGKVLSSEISFLEETLYYSEINSRLLQSVQVHMSLLSLQNQHTSALTKLEELKEYAGLERAYIYKHLLADTFTDKQIEKILGFQLQQKHAKEQFLTDAPVKSILRYTNNTDDETLRRITAMRNLFVDHKLNNTDAKEWFLLTTKRINGLEKAATEIITIYIDKANSVYTSAMSSLYIIAFLWVLSFTALSVLLYILKSLLKHEEQNKEELRIAAYTFDSHEAMTITDTNGNILRVNDAFTEITGYERFEVIGKNPRVLKSMKHSEEFYKEMWRQLHTYGKWSGEIYNRRKNGEVYLERLSITAIKDEKGVATHYIAQFLDITDFKKAQEEAEHQADHDFLTGLMNRKSLTQRLNEEFVKARRHDFTHAYLFIDLDGFKSVNDSYGHDTGDKLLVEVASRIKSVLRQEDLVARMSGDEFAVMALNLDQEEGNAARDLKNIATKLLGELSRVFILNEHKLNISASIGIKIFPDHERNIQEVIVHADAAMYQAKHRGRNRFVFFDKEIELNLKQFSLLEEELNHAYENDEFRFYYQPKVDTVSNKIKGAEMLIRWQHPTKGLLLPAAFLEVAAEIGMRQKITRMVLSSACEFLQSNKDTFSGTLAINICSKQLVDPDFEQEIISAIKHYDVDPSRIELEITENELIKDFDLAISKIQTLQGFGLKFSIDDFGTGYSSITYLQKLPIDILKIDKSFMSNLSQDADRELVKMIINMAKTFKMSVVVEGVEEVSQLDFIKECGAQEYQGFYFSEAVNKESFIKLIENSTKTI